MSIFSDCQVSHSLDEFKSFVSYSQAMGEDGAHVRLYLGTDEPIALNDFVGSFVGIGNQFSKFIAVERPELKAEAEFFVESVHSGSVVADLVVMAASTAVVALPNMPQIIDTLDKSQILAKFVEDIRQRISPYFAKGGRDSKATKSDLSDYLKTVKAIAHDPNASANFEAAVFEDGKRDIRVAFKFSSDEAKEAERQITAHRKELEARSDAAESRVLLRFVRPSIEAGKPGRKAERGIIEKLHDKPLPILYASELTEQRIRHELMATEGNVFHRLFDVDVNVERNASDKPVAYRIMALHQVIEDDGSDSDD